MKDILVIVNPKAGKGKAAKHLPLIKKLSKTSKLTTDFVLTTKRSDATNLTRQNLENYKYILACGGDGTVNEVVNGFDLNKNNLPKFGVLPLGSGNDFGKRLHGKKKNKEIIADYFSNNFKIQKSDICEAEITDVSGEKKSFQFINALGIGFDSFVAKENLDTKIFSGITSYIFAVLRGLKKFNGVKAKVIVNGKQISNGDPLLLVTIGNNKTSGGGFYLNPYAEIDDNMLDVTTVKHLTIAGILRSLPLTLINKTQKIKDFMHHNGQTINVELIEPFIVHADGEIFSLQAKRVFVKLLEKKIELIA